MKVLAFFLAGLLAWPAAAQLTHAGNSGNNPMPVVEGGTGAAAGGTAMDNIAAGSCAAGNGICERTGTATYTVDSIPLAQAKGGTHTTSMAAGKVIVGGDPPTGITEVDNNRIQGVAGIWSVAVRSGSAGSFATKITSYCFAASGCTVNSCTVGSPCTWTRASGTKLVLVKGCGGGGSGATGLAGHAGGGGGGGFCNPYWYFLLPAQAGTSQTISVAAGATSAATAGGQTCFGNGATCNTTKDSTNLFYWGGGQPGVASGASQTAVGSPFGTSTNSGVLATISESNAAGGGNAGSNGSVTNRNAVLYGAPGGAGGGFSTNTVAGGNGNFGPNCATVDTGGTTATSGGNASGSALAVSGAFLPGCGGGGGGGASTGTAGNGGNALGFAAGGGGGGSSLSGTNGSPGNGGNGFVLVMELQ